MATKALRQSRALCLLVALAIVLGGCGDTGGQQSVSSGSELADGQTELYGKVKKVAGNEVQLVLGSYGRSPDGNSGGGGEFITRDGPGAGGPQGTVPRDAADSANSANSSGTSPGDTGEQGEGSRVLRPGQGTGDSTYSANSANSSGTSPGATGVQGEGSRVLRPGQGTGNSANLSDSPSGTLLSDGESPSGTAPETRSGQGMPGGGQFFTTGGDATGGMPEGFITAPGGSVTFTAGFVLGDEERTLIIPITATVTSGQGESASNISFTQIAEKNVLRIVMDQNGTIVRVEILA